MGCKLKYGLVIYNILKIYIVSDLRQVGGFPRLLRFLLQKKDRHDITEILLKVTLNTISLTLLPHVYRSNTSWILLMIMSDNMCQYNDRMINIFPRFIMLYRVHLVWAVFELTTLVVIGTWPRRARDSLVSLPKKIAQPATNCNARFYVYF
jgi:hypothetical protein